MTVLVFLGAALTTSETPARTGAASTLIPNSLVATVLTGSLTGDSMNLQHLACPGPCSGRMEWPSRESLPNIGSVATDDLWRTVGKIGTDTKGHTHGDHASDTYRHEQGRLCDGQPVHR